MAKLTLEELRKLRETKKRELSRRETEGKDVIVTIGMGTCGIAAGAKQTFDALLDEIEKQGLTNVLVKQTGCMGLCYSEPTVEVSTPSLPSIIYGDVDGDVARKIVAEHIKEGKLIENHIFDKPAADIIS